MLTICTTWAIGPKITDFSAVCVFSHFQGSIGKRFNIFPLTFFLMSCRPYFEKFDATHVKWPWFLVKKPKKTRNLPIPQKNVVVFSEL